MRTPRRNSNFSLTLKSELEQIAEEVGITFEQALDIMDIYFLNLKKAISSPLMYKVTINKFGTFTPTVGIIRLSLLAIINKYKANPTLENRSAFLDKYIRSWQVRQYLIKDLGMIKYKAPLAINKKILLNEKKRVLGKDFGKFYDVLGRRIIYKDNVNTNQVFEDEDY